MSTDPEHIAISKSRGINIDWKDAHHSSYDLVYLRDHCPCAACTGAHGTTPRPKSGEEKPNPFQMYTRKFTVKIAYNLIPNYDIFEMFCTQNEKDRAHMVK